MRRSSFGTLASVATAIALASACHGALVGGECISGYTAVDGRCVVASEAGGAGGANGASGTDHGGTAGTSRPHGSSGVGGAGGSSSEDTTTGTGLSTGDTGSTGTSGIDCGALTLCAAGCVDLEVDPDNCGACGTYCPSGICEDGACIGAPGGHAVYAGFDYGRQQQAMPLTVLRNALRLTARDPLRIVDVCSPDLGGCDTVRTTLSNQASVAGKSAIITPALLGDLAQSGALLDETDMLVVHRLDPVEVANAEANAPLAPIFQAFAESGRIVLVLGNEGASDGIEALLAASETVPCADVVSSNGSTSVVDFFDSLANGLVSPFSQSGPTLALDLGDDDDPHVRVVASQASGAAVVHRVFPPQ